MSQAKLNLDSPLIEKYAPREIDDFIGLHAVKQYFRNFVKKPITPSSFIFFGESGTGKTTMAQVLAEEIDAELHHIPSQKCDAEAIDTVTRMCHRGAFNFFGKNAGTARTHHLVLIDEADSMSSAARTALFSKLDRTASPPLTVWVFTCNKITEFEDRFVSRSRVMEFKNETLEGEMEHFLRRIYRKEGGSYPLSFYDIAKQSGYNARAALMKLEVELLMGTDRSGIPKAKELSPVEAHIHNCPNDGCHKTWKHEDPNCELPFRTECQACGGAMTAGSLRAKKAHQTMRQKREEEIQKRVAEAVKKRKKGRAA